MWTSDVEDAAQRLAALMDGKETVAITGAGISTDSGLPDYRGTGSSRTPTVDVEAFTGSEMWRRWVWQRNQETWRAVADLSPNPGHVALARLEAAGLVNGVATQNVDGLHQKAGSVAVAELHGSFERAVCLACGTEFARGEIDRQLRELNPDVRDDPDPSHAAILAAADHAAAAASTFVPPTCPSCGGVLKPSVVFFGENLPGEAIDRSFAWAKEADVALVAGTSLAVLTGMWVLRQAYGTGSEVAIINRGPTQADTLADLRSAEGTSEVLARTAEILLGS